MAQLGWLIDLDKCTGCDSCTIACKSENNTRPLTSPMPSKNGRGVLPDHVSYRWVVKQESGVYPLPRLTFTTSACNHCEHPGCLASCPKADVDDPHNENNAIFKRAEDGIVLINQNVCIGCRNCIHACPYGAPQFNSSTELVEKCTFCTTVCTTAAVRGRISSPHVSRRVWEMRCIWWRISIRPRQGRMRRPVLPILRTRFPRPGSRPGAHRYGMRGPQ